MGSESALGGIQLVNQHFVESEIGGVGVLIVWGDVDGMSVGATLSLRQMHGTRMLVEGAGGLEGTVGIEGKGGDTAAAVIGHQDTLTGFVDGEMAWTTASGREFVQLGELTRAVLDAESRDKPARFTGPIIGFIDGVEVGAVGMNSEETGVFHLGSEADGFNGAADRVKSEDINALALGSCVSADVHQPSPCWGRRKVRGTSGGNHGGSKGQ